MSEYGRIDKVRASARLGDYLFHATPAQRHLQTNQSPVGWRFVLTAILSNSR